MTARTDTATRLLLQARLERPGFVLDVDMALPGKGPTALLGPSGSGKTTCLRVLAGLEPNARGLIQVLGEAWQDSARGVCLPVHRRPLGYVFQEASLFDHLSVQDNIRFGFQRTPPESSCGMRRSRWPMPSSSRPWSQPWRRCAGGVRWKPKRMLSCTLRWSNRLASWNT
jgi:ABC-type branched-subunit amino acid transport system ATPase component